MSSHFGPQCDFQDCTCTESGGKGGGLESRDSPGGDVVIRRTRIAVGTLTPSQTWSATASSVWNPGIHTCACIRAYFSLLQAHSVVFLVHQPPCAHASTVFSCICVCARGIALRMYASARAHNCTRSVGACLAAACPWQCEIARAPPSRARVAAAPRVPHKWPPDIRDRPGSSQPCRARIGPHTSFRCQCTGPPAEPRSTNTRARAAIEDKNEPKGHGARTGGAADACERSRMHAQCARRTYRPWDAGLELVSTRPPIRHRDGLHLLPAVQAIFHHCAALRSGWVPAWTPGGRGLSDAIPLLRESGPGWCAGAQARRRADALTVAVGSHLVLSVGAHVALARPVAQVFLVAGRLVRLVRDLRAQRLSRGAGAA